MRKLIPQAQEELNWADVRIIIEIVRNKTWIRDNLTTMIEQVQVIVESSNRLNTSIESGGGDSSFDLALDIPSERTGEEEADVDILRVQLEQRSEAVIDQRRDGAAGNRTADIGKSAKPDQPPERRLVPVQPMPRAKADQSLPGLKARVSRASSA